MTTIPNDETHLSRGEQIFVPLNPRDEYRFDMAADSLDDAWWNVAVAFEDTHTGAEQAKAEGWDVARLVRDENFDSQSFRITRKAKKPIDGAVSAKTAPDLGRNVE